MKGCIIERNGSLRLKVSLGKNPQTGKYESYYETFHGNRTEAQKRLRQILTELDKGVFVKPGKCTLAEYLRAWLDDYVKLNLSPRTHELYSYTCEKHIIPSIGYIALIDLKPQQIQRLYSEKLSSGLSARTVQLLHVTLHKALKSAVKTGLLARNISELVDKPKGKRHEWQPLSEGDMHLFLDSARETEYYELFYTTLLTGMRRGELLALRWQDIDLLLCQISVVRTMQYIVDATPDKRISFKEPKTIKSRRLIALSPSTVAVLRDHKYKQERRRQALDLPPLQDSDLVFSHWDGTPLIPRSVTQAWRRLTRRIGLKGIRLHDARHTHASLMLKQGVHPKIVQERLGHSSIALTLDTYSHVAPGLQQAAANKFDDLLMPRKEPIKAD